MLMVSFKTLLKKIEEAPIITIWGHAIPDGDCYGCQIGLREIIKDNFPGKEVYALGTGVPSLRERISPMNEADDASIASSLAILVDVSCLRRVEDQRVWNAKSFAKFDHHSPNKEGEEFPYEDAYVEPDVIACAQLIEEFAAQNSLKISKIAAEALYTGILTDSGCFRYFGTNKRTFASVKRLVSCGIEPISIRNIVYYEDDKTKAFKAYLQSKVRKLSGVTYVYITPEEYHRFGLTYEEAGSMVNAIEAVQSPSIFALFTEREDGEVRGELRSNRGFPVQPTATRFRGGGHLFAAGTTTYGEEESMEVVKALTLVTPISL